MADTIPIKELSFDERVERDLNNPLLRTNFREAMDFLMDKRSGQFPDYDQLQELRDLGASIRRRALSKLPDLLEALEEKLRANGIRVHWAETPEQANQIVLDIARHHNARTMIKGKSMVSEETELNEFLEHAGITAVEADMGEYILQLAHEKPSHIVMPAIHKTKEDIARLFAEEVPDCDYTEDVDELIQAARKELRKRFHDADIGLTGVNFMVAETGTLVLVENEGNGRMATTVPKVHIAMTGIEKVIERLDDLPPLLTLLTNSATGQPITTYVNMISSPRKEGEDGPEEVHLVLLDNGRTIPYADEEMRQTLQCIRCAACMNHCPVYTRLGGHAYGTTYPGPIGSILSPHLLGLEDTKDLPSASSLCGACGEVCPVRIPIPDLLRRLRHEGVRKLHKGEAPVIRGHGAKYTHTEKVSWLSWSKLYSSPALYRTFALSATLLRGLSPSKMKGWTDYRTAPKPARQSLHTLIKQHRKEEGKV
ncbi:LutB/LldF family L-lactate oxidation iron-sulfur protein [Parendozoicomonas haliclonae]|uniref:Lactate utilization protein B n=1 Tax=Parendozoicomonas haliclonae TaxID=1960125 RepID=A0A1X7AF61_9GAMM|nr:LutB/LldF family L-lactate oxidation iron-sulfur protein [Parendozoicomonas haliclonae]SMA35234.1 Lactate utilization protein B [Parendozoicomonas haliclonae]